MCLWIIRCEKSFPKVGSVDKFKYLWPILEEHHKLLDLHYLGRD